jgi:deazaflavin-dependent oxidoreductase (nitroreductase family)
MPSDFALKVMNATHRAALLLTGNRIGKNVSGMPSLELTTVGRKSGQKRAILLTAPLIEDETIVVVASRGGDDTHPAWLLNLRDNPDVEVALIGEMKRPMRARVATAEERARMWPIITAKHRNYAGYQKKTDREIPLVLLEPTVRGAEQL